MTVDGNGEAHSFAMPEYTSSTSGSGVTLPHRPSSVTIHRRVSLSDDGPNRDSLDETRAFYGLHGAETQSIGGSISRAVTPHSLSVRGRQRANSHSSRVSASSRPTSPPLTTSPSRSSVPLPIPKSFLSPKKPKAALRHEAQARSSVAIEEQPDDTATVTTERAISPDTQINTARSTAAPATETEADTPAETSNGPPESISHDTIYVRPDSGTHRQSRHVPSITEASSAPTHPLAELSSEDLVDERQKYAAANGHHRENGTSGSVFYAKHPAKRYRRYERFENPLTTFFWGGRAMTGDDAPFSILMVLVLLFGITGVWLGTTGVWLWQHGSEYGLVKGGGVGIVVVFLYLFGITTSSMVAAAIRDPGIIPRHLDPDPPISHTSSWDEPLAREFAVKDGKVTSKYCETCCTYRPPRSSHCRMCGNCVDGIDHHCSYIHTCVGKRNYFAFISLLVFAAVSAIYVVVFSAVHFSLICHHEHVPLSRALKDSPGAAVSFLLGILVMPGIFFLLAYHVRLTLHGLTTVEQLRANPTSSLFAKPVTPFNPFGYDSKLKNLLMSTLARPQFPSWVDASAWEVEDTRLPNPALTDPKWTTEAP